MNDALDSLRKKALFKLINEVFPGETRYGIADETLARFVKEVWDIHPIDFRLLHERLAYDDKPTKEDRNRLAFLYSEKNVDRILAYTYPIRRSDRKENSHGEKRIAKKFIEDCDNIRKVHVQNMIERHKGVIQKYEIASELAKGVLHPSLSKEFS